MTDPYRYTRKDSRLTTITSAITGLIPRGIPASITVEVSEILPEAPRPDGSPGRHTWTGTPAAIAEHVFTALFGRPDKPLPAGPLAQADDAKRRRDIFAEVGALQTGYDALHQAPWYPARKGDLLHIAYERDAGSTLHALGETYVVEPCPDDTAWLQLRLLHHTAAGSDAQFVGVFAPGVVDDPFVEPWMEAGPHRLTVVRDGAVIFPTTR